MTTTSQESFLLSEQTKTTILVWLIWATMLGFALFKVAEYGRNIPVVEDWILVSAITGHEPDMLNWLWRQNAEHRIPLPKLIILPLLKLTHGDFRSGMYFTVLATGVISALMLLVIRWLRGNTSRVVDGFFPMALLHLGNWENFFWTWQVTLAFGCLLIILTIGILVLRPLIETTGAVLVTGLLLPCMPLCGAQGLLAGAFFGLWMAFCAVRNYKQSKTGKKPLWFSVFLFSSLFISAIIAALYFVELEPGDYTPSPNAGYTVSLFIRFLGMSLGVVPLWLRPFTSIFVLVVIIASGWLALGRAFRLQNDEKYRAILLFGMLCAWSLICFITAFARAGLIFSFPRAGLLSRYVLIFCPIILISFFIWELYGKGRWRQVPQTTLFLVMLLLLPVNYRTGSGWGWWYLRTYERVSADIVTGEPVLVIATRHRDDLSHWQTPQSLAEQIKMLHDADMTIFANLPDSSFSGFLKK